MNKLPREFYTRDTLTVARELLGKLIVHETEAGVLKARIVETEAYIGPDDRAAHSYGGRRTKRTEIMYHTGGYAYVYFIYGMYNMFNIVTNAEGKPEAVLIRALEPIEGVELMKKARKTDKPQSLCSGPGKLCDAMCIDKSLYGMDLCGSKLYLEDFINQNEKAIAAKRINVEYAGQARNYPWRFLFKDNPYVSIKK